MKIKMLFLILTASVTQMWAQQEPSNLTCRTSPTAIELSWEQNGFEKTTLFNNSELITHHGVGYAGADVSMYPYQTVGISALHQANRKAAEDFTLFDFDYEYDAAYVSDLVFYVFPQTYFDYSKSPVTEVFVEIYDNSPMNGGQLIYSTDANVKKSDEFINAYRLMYNSCFTDRYMPLYEIRADLGVILPTGGPYWFVFSYNADQNCFLPMRTALGEFVHGNALFYENGGWSWISSNPDNDPGLAFKIDGTWFFYDNPQVIGFNIYRNGVKVNDFLVTETHFIDNSLEDETQYNYTVEAVFSDETSLMSDSFVTYTTPMLGVENVDIDMNVNEIQLNWERPVNDENAAVSYNIYLDGQYIQNVEDTHFSRGYFEQGSYSFRVDAVYFNGLTIPGNTYMTDVSDCFPPTNIRAAYNEDFEVTLTWDEPLEEYLISSFSGEMSNFLATNGFYCEWAIAHRYLPEDLEPYDGLAITQVAFVAGGSDNIYSLQIYTDNGFGGPDHMIYNQQIPSFKMEAWNIVVLETPLIIDPNEVLWIVINSCQTGAGRVFGMSDDFIDMKSNLLYMGWSSESTAGWDTTDSGGCIEIYLGGDSKASYTRDARSYNVFRNNDIIASNIYENTCTDHVTETGTYVYGVQSVNADCTSPVKEISVNVGNEGVDENEESLFKVYPNPGKDVLNIRTGLQNACIKIYDLSGKLIHNQEITDNITSITTTSWPSGTYIWKVIANGKVTESGTWVKE